MKPVLLIMLVLTVATSPLAATLCHTSCAVEAPSSARGNLGHSCHESQGGGTRFVALRHLCGLDDAVTRAAATSSTSGSHETEGAILADKMRPAAPAVVACPSARDSGILSPGRTLPDSPLRI